MRKLTAQKRAELRSLIRSRLESGDGFKDGEQTAIAKRFGVSRQYVSLLWKDEYSRLKNPFRYEFEAAKRRGEKPNPLHLLLKLKYEDRHPAFWREKDPEEN